MNLEALFSAEMLRTYRESWGRDPTAANRLATQIIGMFENPGSAKEEWLRDVVLALVGDEPDLTSWVAAFGKGSFELRPETTYGRAAGKGSPSRFIKRQRELIEGLIDKTLPAGERELYKLAYQDALRLIVASMVVRELRVGVAAKAAIGIGWPVMVTVNDHFLAAEKRSLQRLGGNQDFRLHLAKALRSAVQSWANSIPDGDLAAENHPLADVNQLPPGVNTAVALAYLDPAAGAVQQYRTALFDEFNHSATGISGVSPSIKEMARNDAAEIAGACKKNYMASYAISSSDDWLHFTEARKDNDPFSYDTDTIERLRGFLPILSAPEINMTDFYQAAYEAREREQFRREYWDFAADTAIEIEIHTWVKAGMPPPRNLTREHAKFFEQDVCEKWRVRPLWHPAWQPLTFGPTYAEIDVDKLSANWVSSNPHRR
ncbi:hypothetical protein [Glacieibacterium frigidum]|uniref:hypothetical protein n=1 Tax=Glacieibacterium frigidum TaxID=2593303 RepID=UPI0011853EB2|nr:hypothetical protein [Glacieibacterium frigidum]